MFEIFFPDCVGVDLHPGCDHLPHPGQHIPVQVYLYDYISIYRSIYLSIVYIYYLHIYLFSVPTTRPIAQILASTSGAVVRIIYIKLST